MGYEILIADDSGPDRMKLAASFRRMRPQWKLTLAANADEALSAIVCAPIDLALVDFNCPGTDGLELAALMRRTRPKMPIAVVSAYLLDANVMRAQELKATLIPRPMTEEALAAFLTGAELRLQTEAG
jgi:CheY-like chemotaxis protein